VTPSLRRRILVGSILWTIGMILLASALFTVVMETSRRARFSLLVLQTHSLLQAPLTLIIGSACLVVGLLQVRRGLTRIDALRSGLAGLRTGQHRRLDGEYPAEVQPLVDDLNSLLGHRDQAVQRAIAKAGDLAHGLKTPLAILAQEAERAQAAGQTEIAAAISQQVDRMRRQVDYHLAHARAAASGASAGTRCSIRESADGLARALLRLHAERGIAIEVTVADGLSARVQREDLDEMLGNLLDNACTWAGSRVVVSASQQGDLVAILVDDDGQGLKPEMRESVLQRGVRADEAAPGSGLGLAIVRDLAEVYGGSISLEASPQGGLRARLHLPGQLAN
jgi:signal transduction histidine kinase